MKEQFTTNRDPQPLHPGLEALEDGFCMLDAEWRVTYWNRSAERLTGRSRASALGGIIWEVVPEWRNGESARQLRAVASDRLPVRYLEPRGGRQILSIHASPLADGGLALQFRDATAEVTRSEQYSGLLEAIRDGFIAVDQNWSIVYLNGKAESLLRFPREKAIGVVLWPLLARRWREITDCLRATMNDGLQRHLREVRPEGRALYGKIFDLWTFPLAGGGISILFEDVSERVQRERDLARLAAEAHEANEAKSRFFAAISHELRTPLNAIVGYTHLLGSGTYGEMPANARRAAQRASVCAEHLSRLVDDVLLMTTTELMRMVVDCEEVDLQSFLPVVLEPLSHQAEAKRLSFVLDIDSGVPRIYTDPQRLRQLLVALVSNAVRFTSCGAVTIRVELCTGESMLDDRNESYLLFPERQIEITVTDTGPGIPEDQTERIFGPFEQLGDPSRSDSMVSGSGLGLPIARQLSTLLRGTLELAETSPAGSTFRVRLPLHLPNPTS